jgi:hypothetical protein
LSFLARHETQARGSVPCIEAAEASAWDTVSVDDMAGKRRVTFVAGWLSQQFGVVRHDRSRQGFYIALRPTRNDFSLRHSTQRGQIQHLRTVT